MTSNKSWETNWIRGGTVLEIAWIGKNVLAWCSSMHIIFYDITKQTQTIRWCSTQETGTGACCISGHLTMNIFAYAEKDIEPRILVCSYPSMTNISTCTNGCSISYLATAFVGNEFLASISSCPDFLFTIWKWRTGEKLMFITSWITDSENFSQSLRVSYKKPMLIAQIGLIGGEICIWELCVSQNNVLLTDHKVKLPEGSFAQGMDWCPYGEEQVLAINDKDGHVYLSNQYGTEVNRIVLSQRCGDCLEIEPAAICWYKNGIILKTTFCQIRFYKKDKDRWRHNWHVKSELKPCVLTTYPFSNDRLFYHTREGYLMKLNFVKGQREPNAEVSLFYSPRYKQIDFVYPWAHHLVAVDEFKEISILKCFDGSELGKINLEIEGSLTCLCSHLDFPMIVATSTLGEFLIVSLLNPENPKIVGQYYLQRTGLDLIRFSQCGRYIIVVDTNNGNGYCISLFNQNTIKVIANLTTGRQIADVILFSKSQYLKLGVIFVNSTESFVGNQMFIYELLDNSNHFIYTQNYLELKNNYKFVHHVPGNPSLILGTPYLSRYICIFKISHRREIKVVNVISTDHEVRLANIFTDRKWITSGAFDDYSVARESSNFSNKIILPCHHRRDFGSNKVIMNPTGEMLISLGYEGTIVAMTNLDKQEDLKDSEGTKQKLLYNYQSLNKSIIDMFNNGFEKIGQPDEKITWVDWEHRQKTKKEEYKFKYKKISIQNDLKALREKVINMINENEINAEGQLPPSYFFLDEDAYDQKIKTAGDKRIQNRQKLKEKSKSLDAVTKWMKTTFWDRQTVLRKSIFSISGKMEITNYPLNKENTKLTEFLKYAEFFRSLNNDTVCPYRVYTTSELDLIAARQVQLSTAQKKQKIDEISLDDSEKLDSAMKDDLQYLEGTTTNYFIEQNQLYSQYELYSYSQKLVNSIMIERDCTKLRLHYNELFDEIFKIKDRELSFAREMINQIINVDMELRQMFNQSVPKIPIYPRWKSKEKPESILNVEDYKDPYVSPLEQNLLNQLTEETVQIRKLMLANDFCDRTLISMMDGVLQVRWEDHLKKDIPKPKCLLNKKPNKFTPIEKEIVMQYEKDVQQLNREREKYRIMLKSLYNRTMETYEEGIRKFNTRLKNCYQTRLKVESAILQLQLKIIREELRHTRRLEYIREDDDIRRQIDEKRVQINSLTKKLQLVQHTLPELSLQQETLCSESETLDKKLKTFSSLGKKTYKLLRLMYNRRPHVALMNFSSTHFLDLEQSIALSKKIPYLPIKGVAYFNALNSMAIKMNAMPANLTSIWDNFVSHRRQKIQLELKIKAKNYEKFEMNNIQTYYIKSIEKCHSEILLLNEHRKEVRNNKVEFDLNIEVQLVIKMAQNEISCFGRRSDTSNAVFIARSEIMSINKLIRTACDKKLLMLNNIMSSYKNTLYREWRHRKLRVQVEDLREDFSYMQHITVSKYIETILKRINQGTKRKKTKANLYRYMKTIKRCFEKSSKQWKDRIQDKQLKIRRIENKNSNLSRNESALRTSLHDIENIEGDEARQKAFIEDKTKMNMKKYNLLRRIKQNENEITNILHGKKESEQSDISDLIVIKSI